MLSNERPRSSTTRATVRRICFGRVAIGGGGGGGLAPLAGGAGFSGAVRTTPSLVLMKEKLVMAWGLPSCRMTKSSFRRSVTGLSLESMTTASTCTKINGDTDDSIGGLRLECLRCGNLR